MSAIDSQLPSSSGQDRPTDEVDRILSPGKLIILGLQHVLVMYAGAVAVPLMIGDRLGLSKKLLRCSLARISLLQDRHIIAMYRYRPLYGDPPAGDYVGDLRRCNTNDSHWYEPDIGLLGIFGATIAAGFITTLLAPLIGRLMPLFRHWLPVWLLLLSGLASFRWVLTGPPEVKGIRNMVIPFI